MNPVAEQLAQIYSRVSLECKTYIESDPKVQREDTCRGLVALLEQLKSVLTTVNGMPTEERARQYHVTFNAISYIIDISEYLRKTNFSFEIISILIEAIRSMEENIILNDVKYLDRRTELYLKVAKVYEQWENYQEAVALLDSAIKSYKSLKVLHEQDPPVPVYVLTILNNNTKLLKVFHIKYSIQAGSLTAADWKKKVEEEFPDDTEIKLMCLIECLKTETKKHANIFMKTAKNYKETLLQSGYQMVKPFLETLSKGLSQQKEKMERQVTFKSNMNATQQQVNEEIKKRRQSEQKQVRQSELKKASEACPLEYHAELINYALQMKSTKIISELLECAMVRIECRRIEVPYINDVMITVSSTPYPNVPNGYTKIPTDLNEANLMKELAKLRKSGKKAPEEEQLKVAPGGAPPAKEEKKDSKKGGKDVAPPPPAAKENDLTREPSEWELKEIGHRYVFMMVKKSMSPEGAIYDLGVVLGNEEKGPVGFNDHRRIIVPYIQQNMKIMQSEVKQHTGVRETTGLVPYVILYHSRDSLQSETERKTAITDVTPLIGKNPMVPARWGYKKIDCDLRQVPIEFIKAPNHDYVYLTYKTDELFHLSERHVQIIKVFVELESTWNMRKGGNNQDEKWMELQLNYDIQKLNLFFETVQQSLRGELGQEYFSHRCDFLTSLAFQIWSKYMKNGLLQLDYMREQRLNGEIIDYDYNCYKSILEKTTPVFLRGLKIMNLIMVNNPKADILLEAKISLQLAKLLEENKLYKMAAQNIKLCLSNLRKYRDEYLSKGVEGSSDRLLPFSVTCSNTYIKQTMSQMKKKYNEQRRYIEKVLRIQDRKNRGEKSLSVEELEEEEKEFIRFRKPDTFDETIDKVGTNHSQVYAIVAAIELDLLNLYFRISLKRSEEMTVFESSKNDMTSGIKNTELEGLASTLKQKLTLNEGVTQTKNVQNLSQLQNTLVKANQLPPPRPKLEKMQAKLIAENKKNPYSMVLLMINLAAQNSDNKDKRYYLEEGLRYLSQCKASEAQMMSKAVENAIYIFSGLWDNKIVQDNPNESGSPFFNLYTNICQKETEVPQPPILVTKNSSSVHLKLPPFIPRRRSPKEDYKQVKFMSIYGKPSANGVDVSLNCVELEGTGVRKDIGKTIKISSLEPNNMYVFAAAGIDSSQDNMGIGKTGEDIATFNPFSIPMLASYLAKISYQINEYQVAEKAVNIVLEEYCLQKDYMTKDERENKLYHYTLNEERISGVSFLEIKAISQAFYIAALCHRRKLNEMKDTFTGEKARVVLEQKQKLITNLLVLSGCLSPSLSSPNMSIPFLIPESEVLQRAIMINMIPDKWMNPKIRRLGTSVMSKLMKWGLQKNEINLARRLVYKWNERKYVLMGKTIQIEEKKEVKKGAKQPKDQEVKMIDKYCRMMIEKSPLMMDAFEDSMLTISEEYYDYVGMFIERAKEQIATMGQYVDNTPEELDAVNSHLGFKLELVEYLKEPLQSIKKVPNTSPYYYEYNSKILKKALEAASQAQYKTLLQKAEELDVPDPTDEIKIAKEIYDLMYSAVKEDISWTPSSKMELIEFQKNTGKDRSKAIEIFSSWQQKKTELSNKLRPVFSLQNRFKDFDYLNMWIGQLFHLKAQCQVLNCCNDFQVKRKIRTRYDKIKAMNIEDLFKKEKEVSVLEESSYAFTEDQAKKLTMILSYISRSVYSSLLVSNWLKMQGTLKFLCNLLTYTQMTPFYHRKSQIWTHLAFISLCTIEMLSSIKKKGFWQFKERYNKKLMNTQIASIAEKLQIEGLEGQESLFEEFVAEYYQPDLQSSTTKTFWFKEEAQLDIEPLSCIIAYTVNTLRLQNKHQLVINIVRDFCNVTQHFYSLVLLPFMTNSQSKLLEDVETMIQKENQDLFAVTNVFNAEKQKMGKKRAYLMSGEKMPFEVEYEEKSQKINDSLKFLRNEKQYIESQMMKSNRIKDEITRDTSKQGLAQEEQKKYTTQFGEHYEEMIREYGQQAKHVKKSKNFIKDIINKYDSIYEQLKKSKTSKDPMAQIQNRNEVGNLWFAAGNLERAYEFWNDSLATIFKKVGPIEHYHQILDENRPYLVKGIGQKEIVLAICLLYKISNFTAGHKLQIQKASAHFACHLAYSLFETSLEYPQSYLMYKDFRIKQLPSASILSDEGTINLSELISALEYFILKNVHDQNSLSALPLVAFYEYLGTDVAKHAQTSIKSKIYRSMILSECGLVAESISYLTKVSHEKDLPILWLESSDFLKKEKGMNWTPELSMYNNSELWTNADNKGVLQEFKKLTMKPQTSQQNGIMNPVLFNYAKNLTLSKVYEGQLSKDQALNQQRLQALGEVEIGLRESLKKSAIIEEYYSLLEEWEDSRLQYKQNQVNDELKKLVEVNKAKMIDYLKKNGIEESNLKYYEKEESSALKRTFRLEFMARIRFSIHKLYEARNMMLNSYYTLKNGLTNLHRYTIGARLSQTGFDAEIKAVVPQAPVAGKKDDKKGKKEEEPAPVVASPALDQVKQKELRQKAEGRNQRTALNGYWHIKLLLEIGKLLYKQNNFKQAIKILQMTVLTSQQHEEEYFMLLSKGYIARSRLRLGYFDPEQFKNVISLLEQANFKDINYMALVMDFGELLSEQKDSLEYLSKGKAIAEQTWKRYGMKSVEGGIGSSCDPKTYSLKEEVSAEQEEAIKKKKKGQKKGGKDDKKGAKKQDPKKKKDESKVEYKMTPLSKLAESNLLEEEKTILGEYILNPYPNYTKNNVYQPYAFLFIKTYLRYLSEQLKLENSTKQKLQEVDRILKFVQIIESYPFPTEHIRLGLYACLAKIHKNAFLSELNRIVNYNRVEKPFEDLSLNKTLIALPEYSDFIAQKRDWLLEAKKYYKKGLSLVENAPLLFERSLMIEEVAWDYADNQCLLAEYIGRDKPKFFPEDQANLNAEEMKLNALNDVVEAVGFLEFSIRMKTIKFDLERNYMEIGGKGLEANAKVDEDISSEILEIDKQCKKGYPQFLVDSLKGKATVTGTDLITYMLKAYRQSEFMTFSTPSYQQAILKINRILTKFLPGYKEKCLIASLEVSLRKTLKDKFVEAESLVVKSIRDQKSETFLYVVGPLNEDDSAYYGRVDIELHELSKLTEDLLTLTTKTSISDKKSEAVKNRDYILHKKEFKRLLMELSVRFGNQKTDGNIKQIDDESLVELTGENLKTMNKILDASGFNGKNKDVSKFWRKLHEIKYTS